MNLRRTVLFLLTLFGLAGCSLHQPMQPPEHDLPEAFQERSDGLPARPEHPWWEDFGDPRLSVLMDEMLSGNLRLEQGIARLAQARAVAAGTASYRVPSLSAGGELARAKQPSQFGDMLGTTTNLSLAAVFELDLWGRLQQRERSALLQLEATHYDLQTLYLGLTAELADLYYLAAEQRALLDLTDRTIDSMAETVRRVDSRYRQGLVPALDLYQAEQSLAAAEAVRPNLENSLAAAEHGIAVLLGRYPGPSGEGSSAGLPQLPESFPAGVPADLLQQRPDVAASFARLLAADAEVAAAVAERLPSISLVGGFGRTRQDFSTGLIEGNFWNLAGNLALPLIDGGRRRAEVERTEGVVTERLAGYRQTVLQAAREVEDALAANRLGHERIVRLERVVEVSAASLRLSLQDYLTGLNDYLPVLTAQRNDFQARSELVRARRQQLSNRISLVRALGGAWMADHLERRAKMADHREG